MSQIPNVGMPLYCNLLSIWALLELGTIQNWTGIKFLKYMLTYNYTHNNKINKLCGKNVTRNSIHLKKQDYDSHDQKYIRRIIYN